MYEIDRMVAILKPTQKFQNWVNTHKDDDEEDLTLEELRSDATVILIPIYESTSEATSYIETVFVTLFENELSAWTLDEETWPEPISYALFQEWFDVDFHSLVIDSVDYDGSMEHLDDTQATIQ